MKFALFVENNDLKALLWGILDRGDWFSFLIVADWLEEHNYEPQIGQFIRNIVAIHTQKSKTTEMMRAIFQQRQELVASNPILQALWRAEPNLSWEGWYIKHDKKTIEFAKSETGGSTHIIVANNKKILFFKNTQEGVYNFDDEQVTPQRNLYLLQLAKHSKKLEITPMQLPTNLVLPLIILILAEKSRFFK